MYARNANGRTNNWTDSNLSDVVDHALSSFLKYAPGRMDFSAGAAPYDYMLVVGAVGAEHFAGTAGRDYAWGRAGQDELAGGADDDHLFGDQGSDLLVGGAGGDRLAGGMGADNLYGGTDPDALMGGAGNDFLDEGAGHGDLDGGAGDDTLVGGKGADAFMISAMSGHDVIKDFTAGPGMFDHLAIMDLNWNDLSFSDTVQGVKISWQGGSVLLEGVAKHDLAQDDFMFAEMPQLPPSAREATAPTAERASPSSDGPTIEGRVSGGSVVDLVGDALLAHEQQVFFSFQGDEKYAVQVGTLSADGLNGSDELDHLFGRDGADALTGLGGDDVLQGDAGNDHLDGGAGQDDLDGGDGEDTLIGGDGADELGGGAGVDVLQAGAGHDMIDGGMGDDQIWGGTGADAFMVMPDSGNDKVFDFEAKGAAQGAFDHIAFIDILPNQVKVANTADGALISWDINGDGAADGSVTLVGVPVADLRQSDFMFNEGPAFIVGVSTEGSNFIFA